LPHNAVFSQEAKTAGAAPTVADWPTKRRWVDEAFAAFESAGYEISSGYTLVKRSRHAGFVYRDALWHGADMIGAGVASFSHLAGVHFQNADRWEDYIGPIHRGELPLARALPMSPRQRLIRELVLQFKTGRIDLAYFHGKFGSNLRQDFAGPLDELVREGLAETLDGEVRLTRPGLLRVDSLLPRFFESPFRSVRYT
jgi:oxygen-independent coproporphyrinogen-3 oxidase